MADEKLFINKSTLTDIADAIREKTLTSGLIATTGMADRIRSISGGGEDNGIFFQEYSFVNNINIYNGTAYIDLDVDDVEWLVLFPLENRISGNYNCAGGVYIPDVFGIINRSSYNSTSFESIGCKAGTDMNVENGVLSIHKPSNNCVIVAGTKYGIIGKEKK